MSALTGRLSEDNLRALARIVREIHARAATKAADQETPARDLPDRSGDE